VDVAAWLRQLKLEHYLQAFEENEVDAEVLPTLTSDDLKDLGVVRIGHRRKLLNAIEALRGAATAAPSPPASSVDEESAAARFPEAERRQVTILFADLSGYTQLASELDAEEIHALLGRFFGFADGIVNRYGGTVDKHIGDCVMAVFGAPVAHGNDPERAIRAALDIQDGMAALSTELGHSIGVHIGIASGQVVASGTGSNDHLEYTVTGESVNLASRLTDSARSGQILISDAIQRALADNLDCGEAEALTVKGLAEPVRAWRLRGWRGTRGASRRLFVGRQAELHQFEGALKACLETRSGQAIYVRGEAGIGKSRLIEEFQSHAEATGFACHTSQVLDFGTGTGRDAVRLLVRSLLGLAPGATQEDTLGAAERASRGNLVEPEQRVFLNDLLDLPQPPALRARYDAMDNPGRNRGKSQTAAALVIRVAQRHPLLLVVEDVHWTDRLTLQHLAQLTETVADCPALLVMTSRPEGDPLDQAWRSEIGSSPLMTVDLRPLRRQDAELLAEAYVDQSLDLARQCVERAAGNPLFLEQLLRYAEDTAPTGVPGSVQNLVQARMDRLQAPDKTALQAASVFGQRFSLDALRFLIERAHYDCAEPIAHFLVRPQAGEFVFAHALVRDGVYDSLLKARRRELHRRAADWFAERDAILHAEHLDRADDPAASEAYLDAARGQAGDHHYTRALTLVERGLELTEAGPGVFELTCTRGDVLRELGSIDLSIACFEDAARQALDAAGKCRALIGLASAMRVVGRLDDALGALDQAEPIAREQRLTRDLAQIHHLRGNLYFPLSRLDGCLEQHQLALSLARDARATDLEARALGGLADANFMRGRMLTAHDQYRRCVDLARERGLGAVEIANWAMVGCAGRYTNQLREAWDDSLAAIESAVQAGNQRAEIVARQNAWLLRDMARLSEAKPHFERALALARSLGAKLFEPLNMTELAFIAAAEGECRTASTLIEEAWSASRESRPQFVGAWILGVRARITEDPEIRADSFREGERLLREGCVGQNYYWFYSDAMEAALLVGDWDRTERYASALEAYTRAEPAPWSEFHIARGRALAALSRGRRDEPLMAQIRQLADDARRVGLHLALPGLEKALEA